MNNIQFQKIIYEYFHKHRRNLPWRYEKDPYKILVSEVMLQQTQVSRVISKYNQWLIEFPTVKSLSKASLRDVLIAWQGMGYNRRGKYLKESAQIIVNTYVGVIPDFVEELIKLPGIGQATASAIITYAFNKPTVFIETNIRSVYLYFFFKKIQQVSDKQIAELVEKTMDYENPREWYYALTDYGNFLKTNERFKNIQSKHYVTQSKFKGSRRELRGLIIKMITSIGHVTLQDLENVGTFQSIMIQTVLKQLIDEGLLKQDKGMYVLKN